MNDEQPQAATIHDTNVVEMLVSAGIMPRLCTRLEIVFEVGKAIVVKSECFATKETAEAIANVVAANPHAVETHIHPKTVLLDTTHLQSKFTEYQKYEQTGE